MNEVRRKRADWPPNVAEIYRELAEEDRRLAESMLPYVKETWPKDGDSPAPGGATPQVEEQA